VHPDYTKKSLMKKLRQWDTNQMVGSVFLFQVAPQVPTARLVLYGIEFWSFLPIAD
jgi:hypothetical protein